MVVNESALCGAMKQAYKKGGYKVAAERLGDHLNIMIAAPGWCVVMLKAKMPRKVMALIVEHMLDIPREGQAYQVQKNEVQTEIYDVTTQILERLRDQELIPREVKPTNLHWGAYRLYQCLDTLEILKIDPAYGSIMAAAPRVDLLGDVLTVSGLASHVYIDRESILPEEKVMMAHLSQMQ